MATRRVQTSKSKQTTSSKSKKKPVRKSSSSVNIKSRKIAAKKTAVPKKSAATKKTSTTIKKVAAKKPAVKKKASSRSNTSTRKQSVSRATSRNVAPMNPRAKLQQTFSEINQVYAGLQSTGQKTLKILQTKVNKAQLASQRLAGELTKLEAKLAQKPSAAGKKASASKKKAQVKATATLNALQNDLATSQNYLQKVLTEQQEFHDFEKKMHDFFQNKKSGGNSSKMNPAKTKVGKRQQSSSVESENRSFAAEQMAKAIAANAQNPENSEHFDMLKDEINAAVMATNAAAPTMQQTIQEPITENAEDSKQKASAQSVHFQEPEYFTVGG